VFRINLATLYCHDSSDVVLVLQDDTQTAQAQVIDGRKTDFNKASPNKYD
jgi:hypothetical protein